MRKKLFLSLALFVGIFTAAFADNTYCLINDFGEQASLTISGETVTGTIDYSAFGSTVWPCTGTYDRSTGALHFVARNPNPDNCTFFATTVTFDYTRTDVKTGFGTFSNDCGNFGSLGASASKGACSYAGITLKKGEFGGTATRKMNRTRLPLPPGVDFKNLTPGVAANALSGTTYCLINDFGEQASLSISGETVTGTIDYSAFGSTVWPCTGTYDRSTGTLHFVATNPNPDNCTFFASTVTFDYTRTDVKTGFGTFSNDCGNFGSLGASASKGACSYAGVALKKGEFGSTATRKMNRTKIPLSPGVDFKNLAPGIMVSVAPNPAVKNAQITVKLDAATKINISVYDQSGNLIKTIANGSLKEGSTTYSWNLQSQKGTKVKTGYYTIKVNGSYDQESVKFLVAE